MPVEESLNKTLYKVELLAIKVIPMAIASCMFLNTVLSYLGLDSTLLTYVAGIGVLPILFLYLSSYVFHFCSYHRMFLHYIVVNNILCYIDYTYTLPMTDEQYLWMHTGVAIVFLFLIFYMKYKVCKH